MKQASQSFLFPDTQIFGTRKTIQRTRKQCIYWIKHNGGRFAACEKDKNKSCRPSVCPDFILRKELR